MKERAWTFTFPGWNHHNHQAFRSVHIQPRWISKDCQIGRWWLRKCWGSNWKKIRTKTLQRDDTQHGLQIHSSFWQSTHAWQVTAAQNRRWRDQMVIAVQSGLRGLSNSCTYFRQQHLVSKQPREPQERFSGRPKSYFRGHWRRKKSRFSHWAECHFWGPNSLQVPSRWVQLRRIQPRKWVQPIMRPENFTKWSMSMDFRRVSNTEQAELWSSELPDKFCR